MMELSQRDIRDLAALVATETENLRDPVEYQNMVNGITQTVLNRAAKNGTSVRDEINRHRAFSKITGPKRLDPYGSIQNTPNAPQRAQQATEEYLLNRAAGGTNPIGGATHYANPNYSDKSNLDSWVNPMIDAGAVKYGQGDAVHYHGVAPGETPAPDFNVSLPADFRPPIDGEVNRGALGPDMRKVTAAPQSAPISRTATDLPPIPGLQQSPVLSQATAMQQPQPSPNQGAGMIERLLSPDYEPRVQTPMVRQRDANLGQPQGDPDAIPDTTTFTRPEQNDLAPDMARVVAGLDNFAGQPQTITSGFRNKAYNKSVGGAPKSFHVKKKAADRSMSGLSNQDRFLLAKKAKEDGAKGFITYSSMPDMLHMDTRNNVTHMHDRTARKMGGAPDWHQQLASGKNQYAPKQAPIPRAAPVIPQSRTATGLPPIPGLQPAPTPQPAPVPRTATGQPPIAGIQMAPPAIAQAPITPPIVQPKAVPKAVPKAPSLPKQPVITEDKIKNGVVKVLKNTPAGLIVRGINKLSGGQLANAVGFNGLAQKGGRVFNPNGMTQGHSTGGNHSSDPMNFTIFGPRSTQGKIHLAQVARNRATGAGGFGVNPNMSQSDRAAAHKAQVERNKTNKTGGFK